MLTQLFYLGLLKKLSTKWEKVVESGGKWGKIF
jgi:hypothetical protein